MDICSRFPVRNIYTHIYPLLRQFLGEKWSINHDKSWIFSSFQCYFIIVLFTFRDTYCRVNWHRYAKPMVSLWNDLFSLDFNGGFSRFSTSAARKRASKRRIADKAHALATSVGVGFHLNLLQSKRKVKLAKCWAKGVGMASIDLIRVLSGGYGIQWDMIW